MSASPATDPARALAAHVCATQFTDLPESAVGAARADILDTLGCALGGSSAPGIAELMKVTTRWGGREEASVLLSAARLPAPQAALMNASMAHALDFDDTLDHGGSIHPGASVFAAALAVADTVPDVTGKDLLLAVTLGLDVSCRIALAATVDRGWHRTAAIGVFGAAAAAGKLLGLTEDQMVHAFGIAYSHAAGNRQCILDGALSKRLQAGQAASSGVFSAVLAQEDFTGAYRIFAGAYGFFELYQPGGYDLAPLTDRLGSVYRGEELSFKPYPCGRPLHATIDAALALHRELGLTAGNDGTGIAELTLTTDAATYADQFETGPHKRQPTQIVQAQFALPFLVAAALTRGKVGLGELADLKAPDVLALSARIHGASAANRTKGWASLTAKLTDGRTATIETGIPLGAPENPLTPALREQKFRDCAANAIRPISAETVSQAIRTVGALQDLPRAADLLRSFG
jgi:2-methylcitrate dehydratase PrpD